MGEVRGGYGNRINLRRTGTGKSRGEGGVGGVDEMCARPSHGENHGWMRLEYGAPCIPNANTEWV